MENNKTLLNQSPADALGIGVCFVLMVAVVLNVAGLIEYTVAGMLHAWSISAFMTVAVLIVTLPVAFLTEYAFEEKKIRNKFTRVFGAAYWLMAVVLSSITVLITLWCMHWILGLVVTLATLAGIVGAGIIEYKSKEE